jgi:hypothetical protein
MFTHPLPHIFDPLDLALLCRLFSQCCETSTSCTPASMTGSEMDDFRVRIAKSLIRSLAKGERDPEILKHIALQEALLPQEARTSKREVISLGNAGPVKLRSKLPLN